LADDLLKMTSAELAAEERRWNAAVEDEGAQLEATLAAKAELQQRMMELRLLAAEGKHLEEMQALAARMKAMADRVGAFQPLIARAEGRLLEARRTGDRGLALAEKLAALVEARGQPVEQPPAPPELASSRPLLSSLLEAYFATVGRRARFRRASSARMQAPSDASSRRAATVPWTPTAAAMSLRSWICCARCLRSTAVRRRTRISHFSS
jgi:hypothetical protein